MPTHSTNHKTSDENESCPHSCEELIKVVKAAGRLFEAFDDVVDAQHGHDPTTWINSQAINFFEGFVEHHPIVTVDTLIDGLDACSKSLKARVLWERNQ